MWPLLLSAGLGLAGSLFNYFGQKKTNQTQIDLMREQNQFNASQVDKQNEYNTPANQMARMQEAGLNPAFLFGANGVDSTQPTAATGAAVPGLSAPQLDLESPAKLLFEQKRLQNETLRNEADIDKILAERDSLKKALSQSDARFAAEIDKIKADTNLSDADRQLALQRVETEKASYTNLLKTAEKVDYEIELLVQKASTERWSQRKFEREIDRMVQLLPFEKDNLASQSELNDAQKEEAHSMLMKIKQDVVKSIKEQHKIDAETLSIIIDNTVKDSESISKINKANIRGSRPVLDLLLDETTGWLHNAISFVNGVSLRSSINQQGYSNQSVDYHNNYHSKQGSSWLFKR